jgi:hypothetical protein
MVPLYPKEFNALRNANKGDLSVEKQHSFPCMIIFK